MVKVKFTNNGEEEEVAEGTMLRDVIKDKGWPVAFGCEDGVCGTCLLNIVDGYENLSEMEDTEAQTLEMMDMKDGCHRLGCQCKVKGDVSVEGM